MVSQEWKLKNPHSEISHAFAVNRSFLAVFRFAAHHSFYTHSHSKQSMHKKILFIVGCICIAASAFQIPKPQFTAVQVASVCASLEKSSGSLFHQVRYVSACACNTCVLIGIAHRCDFRCSRPNEDFAAIGKRFAARNPNITKAELEPVVLVPGLLVFFFFFPCVCSNSSSLEFLVFFGFFLSFVYSSTKIRRLYLSLKLALFLFFWLWFFHFFTLDPQLCLLLTWCSATPHCL